VWREHVAPLLSQREAAGLRVVCKALKALVREWPSCLGSSPGGLKAALTCFPATESLRIVSLHFEHPLYFGGEARLVEVLRRHGGTLKRVTDAGLVARRLLSSAVRAGALPNLTFTRLSLRREGHDEHRQRLSGGILGCLLPNLPFTGPSPRHCEHRQMLSSGMLRSLEEVEVTLQHEDREPLEALEHLRDLPLLRRLSLSCAKRVTAAFPPFIPPSLKSLVLIIDEPTTLEALLRELPAMLQASGARLEEIDIRAPKKALSFEGGDLLAQVLEECATTLKTLKLGSLPMDFGCIQDLLRGLVTCCSTLEVLHCPWAVFSALPVTCPSFPRLTKLHLQGGPHANIGFSPRLWDIMITGRLPALAELSVADEWYCLGEYWATDGGRRLARAFEAVGGTLRRLTLKGHEVKGERACHELGAAIGKLRRLRSLRLGLPRDGKTCHHIARGLAASGGCPELFELELGGVWGGAELLTYEPSLIVPTVRDLRLGGVVTDEDALLMCCGLAKLGRKLRVDKGRLLSSRYQWNDATGACMRAILRIGGVVE
jgi:hypothetical protein